MQFLAELNGRSFTVPSSKVFADAVKQYREVFAHRMLRTSTFSVAEGHLKTHLQTDWNNVPDSGPHHDGKSDRVGLEEAKTGSLLGDGKEHSAHHAARLNVVQQRPEGPFLSRRSCNPRKGQTPNEDRVSGECLLLLGTGVANRGAHQNDGHPGRD